MRCKFASSGLVATDTAEKNRAWSFDVAENVWTSFMEAYGGIVDIAASAVKQVINFGTVAAGKFIIVKLPGTTAGESITVRLNLDTGTEITLKSVAAADGTVIPGCLILLGDAVTAMFITNPAATAIKVLIGIAGDS